MEELLAKPMAVYLVGWSWLDNEPYAEFLYEHGVDLELPEVLHRTDLMPEMAGRICYMSYGKGRKTNAEFINNILSSAHGSVLEHSVFSFIITGVSRSLTHELIRHRHLSYSQLSQRYVDESDVKFIMPDEIKGKTSVEGSWYRSVQTSLTAYKTMIGEMTCGGPRGGESKTEAIKRVRQAARSVLPNCTETKIVVTGNARAWRHFLEVRGSSHAEPEIRKLAVMICTVLKNVSPHIFQDFEEKEGCLEAKYKKV